MWQSAPAGRSEVEEGLSGSGSSDQDSGLWSVKIVSIRFSGKFECGIYIARSGKETRIGFEM